MQSNINLYRHRFKKGRLCFIIAMWIIKPLSIPQQTIFLSLHMVINHGITIFDFSWFLIATLTFWVAKSCRGFNGPVYPKKGAASLHVTWPTCGVKGCKKKINVTPLVGLMDPVYKLRTQFLWMLPVPKDPLVVYKGVNNKWE